MKILGSISAVVTFVMLVAAGCSSTPELYCDETQACTAGHPVCDFGGVCPLSGGVKNTCIPAACWDAAPVPVTDAGVDGGVQPDATVGVDAGPEADAAPLPDADPGCGPLVAFERGAGGARDIWVVNPDGTGLTNITQASGDDTRPIWSPDAARILYANGNSVKVMNADGSAVTPIADIGVLSSSPFSWSPDSTKVVYSAFLGGQRDVYVANADGTGTPAQLTDDSTEDWRPRWSPDGTKIVWSRNRDIYTMNANGSSPTPILTDISNNADPQWSIDGGKITYQDGGSIWAINADGSGVPGELGANQAPDGSDSQHTWSRGGKIAFRLSLAGFTGIYQVVGIGGAKSSITTTATDFAPSWSPDGASVVFERAGGITVQRVGAGKTDLSSDGASPRWRPCP